MKNEKAIIKKIIKTYLSKFAWRDIELYDYKCKKYFDTEQKYYNYLNKCGLKTLQKELAFQVSINKKEERKDPEYYDTISYNYYGGKL